MNIFMIVPLIFEFIDPLIIQSDSHKNISTYCCLLLLLLEIWWDGLQRQKWLQFSWKVRLIVTMKTNQSNKEDFKMAFQWRGYKFYKHFYSLCYPFPISPTNIILCCHYSVSTLWYPWKYDLWLNVVFYCNYMILITFISHLVLFVSVADYSYTVQ